MQLQCVFLASFLALDADLAYLSVPDQVNATWACENDRTLNQILKGELGFQGYIMSDWGAHHSTLAAVAGLDVGIFRGSSYGRVVLTLYRCRCRATSRSAPARAGGVRT